MISDDSLTSYLKRSNEISYVIPINGRHSHISVSKNPNHSIGKVHMFHYHSQKKLKRHKAYQDLIENSNTHKEESNILWLYKPLRNLGNQVVEKDFNCCNCAESIPAKPYSRNKTQLTSLQLKTPSFAGNNSKNNLTFQIIFIY